MLAAKHWACEVGRQISTETVPGNGHYLAAKVRLPLPYLEQCAVSGIAAVEHAEEVAAFACDHVDGVAVGAVIEIAQLRIRPLAAVLRQLKHRARKEIDVAEDCADQASIRPGRKGRRAI